MLVNDRHTSQIERIFLQTLFVTAAGITAVTLALLALRRFGVLEDNSQQEYWFDELEPSLQDSFQGYLSSNYGTLAEKATLLRMQSMRFCSEVSTVNAIACNILEEGTAYTLQLVEGHRVICFVKNNIIRLCMGPLGDMMVVSQY